MSKPKQRVIDIILDKIVDYKEPLKTFYITHSGIKIDLENITANDITIDDIAHHLTKICRYGGALDLNLHYSVANHSIALYYYAWERNVPIEVQRGLLMHDAAEAYLGDIVAGLKPLLPCYKELELKVEKLITSKYGLSTDVVTASVVKELDTRILLDEAKVFMPQYYRLFQEQLGVGIQPLGIRLYTEKTLSITKAMFLHCCEQLGIKD